MSIFTVASTAPNSIRPELLTHPTIPMDLLGVNPRSIMGTALWDQIRAATYAANNHCCWACGVHAGAAWKYQWLEAHETYTYEPLSRVATLHEIVALCHRCHMFNHIGSCIEEEDEADVLYILDTGFALLPDELHQQVNAVCRYALFRYMPERYRMIYGDRADFTENLPLIGWKLNWKGYEWRRSYGRLVCRPEGSTGLFMTAVRAADGSLVYPGGINAKGQEERA